MPSKKYTPPLNLDEDEELDPELADLLEDEEFWTDLQKKAIEPANKSLWTYFVNTAGMLAWAHGAMQSSRDMTGSTEDVKKWVESTDYAKKWFDERGAQFVTQVSDTDREHIRDLLKENWGVGEKQFSKNIADDYLLSKERAELIYRSETHETHEAGAYANAFYNGGRFKSWVSNGENACEDCQAMDGETTAIDLPYSNGEMFAHAHPNCILPDTKCLPLGGLVTAFRSAYSGPVIKLTLSSGSNLTITPNHPILTTRGFIPAKALRKRDNILYCPDFERIIPANQNDNRIIPTIEQIFNSLSVSRKMSSREVPPTPEDFHGDGKRIKGKIDIIRADGFLGGTINPSLSEHFSTPNFNSRNARLREFNSLRFGEKKGNAFLLPPDSIMRRRSSSRSLFWGEGSSYNSRSLTTISRLDSDPQQAFSDDSPGTAEMLGHTQNGPPIIIEPNNIVGNDISSTRSAHDVIRLKIFLDEALRATQNNSNLSRCHARLIEVDYIRSINILQYHGYVYDLESISSYLICNGVYVSNCGCYSEYSTESPYGEAEPIEPGEEIDFGGEEE